MKHFIYHFRKDNLQRFWAKETFRFSKLDQIKSPKRKAFGMFNKTLRKCKVNGAAFHGRAIVLANNRTNYYSIFLKVKDQVAAIYHSQLSPSHHSIVPILLEANFLAVRKYRLFAFA